jgi:hypothetical protein
MFVIITTGNKYYYIEKLIKNRIKYTFYCINLLELKYTILPENAIIILDKEYENRYKNYVDYYCDFNTFDNIDEIIQKYSCKK